MRHHPNKKVVAAALTAGLVFGASGVAVAWFTEGGTGSGTAQVGTGTTGVFDITTPGPSSYLTPGSGPQSFDLVIHNTSGADAHIGTVYMEMNSKNGDAATSPGNVQITGCTATWFTVSTSVAVDQTIAAGATVHLSNYEITEPTIAMSNVSASQDDCQATGPGILFSTSGF